MEIDMDNPPKGERYFPIQDINEKGEIQLTKRNGASWKYQLRAGEISQDVRGILLEPIYESRFIYDTFANRKNKGTSNTLKRFDYFRRKYRHGYALKADIKHYFDSIDQEVLLSVIGERIKDERIIKLIRLILENHKTPVIGKGMPLGNLTSQFFANIYLSKLDEFIKHRLGVKHYLRYVDDFILLSNDNRELERWKTQITEFLGSKLLLELHGGKTRIIPLKSGVPLVGFRIFQHHKLLKKGNIKRVHMRVAEFKENLKNGSANTYLFSQSLAGWNGYAKLGNTYNLRKRIEIELK